MIKSYSGQIDLTDRNCSWTKIIEMVGWSKRVLEVGCAQGYISEYLAKHRDCRVTAIDLNPESTQHVGAYCEDVIIGDVEGTVLDELSGRFDVIIAADVLEHLRDPWGTLRRLRTLLNEKGYVLISVPNVVHWEIRCAFLAGRFEYTKNGILDNTHLRFFTRNTALHMIRDSGFEIEESDVVFRGPRYWKYGFYRRWERPIAYVVKHFVPGLFGFQFVFRIHPRTDGRR